MTLLLSLGFGATIGYVANRVAVKLIFWPYRPIHVFGFRVPFTPGMFIARRIDFGHAFARALVERFCNAEDVIRVLGQALDAGLEERLRKELPPIIVSIFDAKVRRMTPENVHAFACEVSRFVRESDMVPAMVVENLKLMDPAEVEEMFDSIAGRERRAIAYLDAGIGALGGLAHWLVAYLVG